MRIDLVAETVKRCTFENLKIGECFTVYGPNGNITDNHVYMKVKFVTEYAVDLNEGRIDDTFSDDDRVFIVDGEFSCQFVPAEKKENE